MTFIKAKKEQSKLRLVLNGPSGSGKTYSALNMGQYIGRKIAFIDTEGNSASKYANLFDFDVINLTDCHPRNFIQAIDEAVKLKYDLIIIDSLSHAWNGKNGILELTEREKLKITNKFQAWGKTSPIQTEFVNKLLTANIHIIATLRVKTAYDMQEDDNGKKKPVKIGLAPIQKEGIEYEFDIMADMTPENNLIVSKTRCPELNGYIQNRPGKETADIIKAWLSDGVPPQTPKQTELENQPEPQKEKEPAKAKTVEGKPAEPRTMTVDVSPKENPETKTIPAPAKGMFDEIGILQKIAEKQEEKGPVWGYILEGSSIGFRSYSAQLLETARQYVGQKVIAKVLAGPNGYNLISIKLAN